MKQRNTKCYTTFPILKERFQKGFFTRFLNEYFVLLVYFSKIAGVNFDGLLKEVVTLVFTRDMERLNKYDKELLYKTINQRKVTPGVAKTISFTLQKSGDVLIITAILLYLKKENLEKEKTEYLKTVNNLLYIIDHVFPKVKPVLKVWKTGTQNLTLQPFPEREWDENFEQARRKLHIKLFGKEQGKMFTPRFLSEVRNYDSFLAGFCLEKYNYMSQRRCSMINKSYGEYQQEVQFIKEIKYLIEAGKI